MDDTGNTERASDPAPRSTTERPASTGNEAVEVRAVEGKIRITPLSLLWSATIGAVALGIPFLTGAWAFSVPLFSVGNAPSGTTPFLASGLWLLPAFGALLVVLFATGYRRHGRPVPTEAWAREGALVVKVPAAWGRLVREALYLEDPRIEAPRREARPEPGASSSFHSADPSGTPLVVTGTAPEWWDPATYEVHVAPPEAEILRATLTNRVEDTLNQ